VKADVKLARIVHGLGKARYQLDRVSHELMYPDRRETGGYSTGRSGQAPEGVSRKPREKWTSEHFYIRVLSGGSYNGREVLDFRSMPLDCQEGSRAPYIASQNRSSFDGNPDSYIQIALSVRRLV